MLLQLADLEGAHAVLGRNRAAKALDRVKDQGVDHVFALAHEDCRIDARRSLHVVVQIAIAQMAEVDQPHPR